MGVESGVNVVMHFMVPQIAGNFLTTCETICFSRRALLHGVNKYKVWKKIKVDTPVPAKMAVIEKQPHLWGNIFRSEWWNGMERVRKVKFYERKMS